MASQQQTEDGPSQPLGDIKPLIALPPSEPPVLPEDAPQWEKDYWIRRKQSLYFKPDA